MRVLLFLSILVLAFRATGDESTLPDHSWMRRSTVTAYRLAGYGVEETGVELFHNLVIREAVVLDPATARKLGQLLEDVTLRNEAAERETSVSGKISGGVWGCSSGDQALRFVADGDTHDFIVECGLWIRPAEKNARGRGAKVVIFTIDEALEYFFIVNPLFKGPIPYPGRSRGVAP